jgi:hypothetical protein
MRVRYSNPQQPNPDKDNPKKQPLDNQSKTQENKGKGKMKNDIGKWCNFQNIHWHNIDECFSKQSLVVEIKDKESNYDSEYDPENNEKEDICNDPKTNSFLESITTTNLLSF